MAFAIHTDYMQTMGNACNAGGRMFMASHVDPFSYIKQRPHIEADGIANAVILMQAESIPLLKSSLSG